MKKFLPVFFFILFGISMIMAIMRLFPVGDPHLPAYADFVSSSVSKREVSQQADSVALRYNRGSVPDSNSISVVGAVILDYRGYDTLCEATVIFTALMAVLAVLGIKDD